MWRTMTMCGIPSEMILSSNYPNADLSPVGVIHLLTFGAKISPPKSNPVNMNISSGVIVISPQLQWNVCVVSHHRLPRTVNKLDDL